MAMAMQLCSAIGSAIGGTACLQFSSLVSFPLFSLLFSSLLSTLFLSSLLRPSLPSDAIADMPSSLSISTSPQEKSISPHPNPHSLISIHFLLSIPTQILRASQNSRMTIDLYLNLFNLHLFNIEFHFFSIFYQKKLVLASSKKDLQFSLSRFVLYDYFPFHERENISLEE